jgi:NAD(P)-dependent dehydrogenase (short-subunit alcohol dehydrogenase family)
VAVFEAFEGRGPVTVRTRRSGLRKGRMMEGALHGKTILVTGGGSGLGAALCRTLAAAGGNLVIGDIRPEAAEAVAREVRSAGGQCMALALDVADEAGVAGVLEQAVARFERLDVVINNAGTDVTVPFDELDTGDWHRILATNLTGPFLVARAAMRYMKPRGRGHIVNVASTAAKRAWPNASAYHASKWGLLGLSHALHAELRSIGIKVTAVIAGGMRTPFLLERFPDIDLNVLQSPDDVAETVKAVLLLPEGTVVPEIMVLPMRESSWP